MKSIGRRSQIGLALFVAAACFGSPSQAQIKANNDDSVIRYGATQVSRFQVGVVARAKRGAAYGIFAIVAVPLTCDEQAVELEEEDISSQVSGFTYRSIGTGARQMLVKIPFLAQGEEAHALLTFEIRNRIILEPKQTAGLMIPVKPDRQLKRYLGKSPFIQTKHGKFKKICQKIEKQLEAEAKNVADITDWQRVEAIYDYVQQSIEYLEGADKSALQTLKDGKGDCQDISALFVALCRTYKVPARMVWVHEHSYPEFCLVDQAGKQYWFPCESAGDRAFGEMPIARTILQKGDSFKMPERPREVLRYASDYATAEARPGAAKPSIKFVRQAL